MLTLGWDDTLISQFDIVMERLYQFDVYCDFKTIAVLLWFS